jgi:hypothetical protein
MIVYIYALLDPDTDDVRYIGKTKNLAQRLSSHCLSSSKQSNPHKWRWIDKLKADGKKPKMLILDQCEQDSWQESERHWIAHYRSIGARLTNIADGGLGTKLTGFRESLPPAPKAEYPFPIPSQLGILQASALARNKKGGFGVNKRYIQAEIARCNLKAELVTPDIGKPYYLITEEDFLAWEEKRGRSPGDEP